MGKLQKRTKSKVKRKSKAKRRKVVNLKQRQQVVISILRSAFMEAVKSGLDRGVAEDREKESEGFDMRTVIDVSFRKK